MNDLRPKSSFWSLLEVTYKSARRIVVAVIGVTVLLIGVAMVVLPGPAVVVIPAGLAILSAEFAFARRWLRYLKRQARNGMHTIGFSEHPALTRTRRISDRSRRRKQEVVRLDLPSHSRVGRAE